MKFMPTNKDNDYNLFNEELIDKFFDFPYSAFGKNMQKMKTDIIESKDKYIIKIDIPGYDKNDIKVHVGDNLLTVYVKKEDEEEILKEGKYLYRERYVGTVTRSFKIGNVKEEDVKASYKNGTLTLTYPKDSKVEKEKSWIRID